MFVSLTKFDVAGKMFRQIFWIVIHDLSCYFLVKGLTAPLYVSITYLSACLDLSLIVERAHKLT